MNQQDLNQIAARGISEQQIEHFCLTRLMDKP